MGVGILMRLKVFQWFRRRRLLRSFRHRYLTSRDGLPNITHNIHTPRHLSPIANVTGRVNISTIAVGTASLVIFDYQARRSGASAFRAPWTVLIPEAGKIVWD